MNAHWMLSAFALALLSSGCAHGPSIEQRRAVTTRVIPAPAEMVFRATLTVLQDEGYGITETDLESGLISASVSRDANAALRSAFALSRALVGLGVHFGDDPEDGDETEVPERLDVEVTAVVSALEEEVAELRITMVEVEHVSIHTVGKDEVRAEARPQPVYDEELYEELFNTIRVEVERRRVIRPLTNGSRG